MVYKNYLDNSSRKDTARYGRTVIDSSRWYALLILLILLLALADLFCGAVAFPPAEILHTLLGSASSETIQNIVYGYRLPKMLTAILVGSSLSISGMVMQRFFRNPLAGPFVLGVSSGATLGAALAILLGSTAALFPTIAVAGAAALGAMTILFFILLAAMRLPGKNTILIFGILLSAVALGVVNILQYISNERALKLFVVWSLGSLTDVTGSSLILLALSTIIGLIGVYLSLRPLTLLQLGTEQATSLGLSTRLTTVFLFLATSLLAGVTTAFCGPIGFIGLVVPNMARLLFRTADLKILFWATLLLGILSMLSLDIISQLCVRWIPLPLNALVAIWSVPFMIYLLFFAHRIHHES